MPKGMIHQALEGKRRDTPTVSMGKWRVFAWQRIPISNLLTVSCADFWLNPSRCVILGGNFCYSVRA